MDNLEWESILILDKCMQHGMDMESEIAIGSSVWIGVLTGYEPHMDIFHTLPILRDTLSMRIWKCLSRRV